MLLNSAFLNDSPWNPIRPPIACVKIAMIMAMITQAFRFAYEPIVFASCKERDSKEYYAKGMKYFIVFTLLAFLCVMAYMNILQYMIGPEYREGLRTVPIVMAAEIMMGVYSTV